MFSINIKSAEKILSELQTQLRQLNQIVFEMDASVSKYEHENQDILVKERMRKELEILKSQRKKFLELVSAMRTILEVYEETEEQILEYEGCVSRQPMKEAAWVPVTFSEETKSFIRQIKV